MTTSAANSAGAIIATIELNQPGSSRPPSATGPIALIDAVITAQAAIRPHVVAGAHPRRTSPSSDASDATSTGTPAGATGISTNAISAPAAATPIARPLRVSAISSATKKAG